MLKIHQPYIKRIRYFALASIGAFLLGSLMIVNLFSESSSVSAAEIKYMQQFTNPICQSMTTGETMDLIDPRGESEEDFQTYKIMKMPDGTCWMVENLRLGNDTTKISLTANDTDLNGTLKNWTLPASYESEIEEHNGTVWNDGGYNEAMVKTGKNLGTDYKEAYGNYYSWCAATAETCMNGTNPLNNTDAPSSICPKGWQLPVGTTGAGSFQNLYNQYPNSTSAGWLTNQTVSYNGGTSAGYSGKRFGVNSADAFFPAAGYVDSRGLSNASSYGVYWSRRAYSTATSAYLLDFNSSNVYPQSSNNRYLGFSVRCVADPTVTESDFTYSDIEWSDDKTGDVTVNVPSILTIDAASGLTETADASKIIEGTATATISSNTEYNVTLHSTQPSLKDPTITTAEISPVSSSNPVQPGNNSWGFWDGTGSADTKSYTLPITTEPQAFYNTPTDVTLESGDPATLHTYYVGISISPSLPSGTYATDVIITASTK